MQHRNRKIQLLICGACVLLIFLAWRMIRPMNIFVVSDEFAVPMAITLPPAGLDSLRASECGECHGEIYREWSGSMHAKAWTDPYFQVDFVFDGSQQICLNCHIPLQNQQENLVTGFRDRERFDPILVKNPDYDPELQQEGVTCAVCHVRDGVITGPDGNTHAPHPTRYDPTMTDGIGVCRKCHVVSGKRWDTFFRLPPCGTVSEIRQGHQSKAIDCVGCHMPQTVRPSGEGGENRSVRRHLWRGGHHRETVRQALQVVLAIHPRENDRNAATLTLTNIGADHFLPTGTPDRHLSVTFMLRDGTDTVLTEKTYKLKRHIMWRPFIVDLRDTRLIKDQPRKYDFTWKDKMIPEGGSLAVTVRYHLLDEARRKRIGYRNTEPISYPLFQKNIQLPLN